VCVRVCVRVCGRLHVGLCLGGFASCRGRRCVSITGESAKAQGQTFEPRGQPLAELFSLTSLPTSSAVHQLVRVCAAIADRRLSRNSNQPCVCVCRYHRARRGIGAGTCARGGAAAVGAKADFVGDIVRRHPNRLTRARALPRLARRADVDAVRLR
jgi:hypothetical protein